MSSASVILPAVLVVGLSLVFAPLWSHETVLGIDLGTTFSVACVCYNGNVTVIHTNGQPLFPSAVSYEPGSAPLAGYPALARRQTHAGTTVYDSKRLIGRRFSDPTVAEEQQHMPFTLVNDTTTGRVAIQLKGDQTVTPEQVGAVILRILKNTAELAQGWVRHKLGFRFHTATVSVPVLFHGGQRRSTEIAATLAGFRMVRLIEEPVAAAIAYELHSKGSKHVLVYDLGGGTLDVALLHLTPDTRGFLVRETAGDPHLGGEDFDRVIMGLVTSRLIDAAQGWGEPWASAYRTADQVTENRLLLQQVWQASEGAKRRLQTIHPNNNTRIHDTQILLTVPPPLEAEAARNLSITMTSEEIDQVVGDLIERAMLPVTTVLEEAHVTVEYVDDVVLVGGSTRLVLIRQRLAEKFGASKLHYDIDPDLAIAIGASRAFGC